MNGGTHFATTSSNGSGCAHTAHKNEIINPNSIAMPTINIHIWTKMYVRYATSKTCCNQR